ncbi:hypothetical protein Ddye_025950 [Dipteronia dyeriana]|uniref:Retrotransposon Copia-like N-terminal domain-containing protein n=1 Tax=Dipteronia dyeriana TaxID=168575 RepID=A0AAD9TMD4_9ROSI|nr:hypothetical protein Ddye_025950 [Dipteronia dyeriana]
MTTPPSTPSLSPSPLATGSTTATVEPTVVTPTSNPIAQTNAFYLYGNLISLNASSQIPFKLSKDGGNYASWKSQMTNLLFGYGLLGFIDRSHPCPLKTYQKHLLWLRQDRLVLFGIQATVHSTIGSTINNCSTSVDAWNKLETGYANHSNTHVISLLSTLMSIKKEGFY